MAKRLGGKRWFKARGARLQLTPILCDMIGEHIPAWASNAFLSGWAETKRIREETDHGRK